MPPLTCDRIDYRETSSRIVVDEKEKTVTIYLNDWMRYLFQVDEMEIKKVRKGKMKKVFLVLIAALFLAGCAGIQIGGGDNTAQFGLELAAFNAGYLIAEKYPAKIQEIKTEVVLLEGVLAGEGNAEAMNAAFQLAVAKLLKATGNDPLVSANILFISKKIQFTEVPGGKPMIDLPQMKVILTGFKDGVLARELVGGA
jgi:hypothetical protein